MKIALVTAFPRPNGFTARLTRMLTDGLVEGGAAVDTINCVTSRIEPCIGCYRCWLVTPGVCIHQDDMPGIIDRIRQADSLVLATPLYSYMVSSHAKIFMDRLFSQTEEGFETTPDGLMRNSIRNNDRWPRYFSALLAGAFREKNFAGAVESLRLYAGGLNLTPAGTLIRPESFLLPFDLAKPKTLKTIESAFVQAGRELATKGVISPETLSRAATPLSSDVDSLARYSGIYWEHAGRIKSNDVTRVSERMLSDMRILLGEMVRCVDTTATRRVRASILFTFTDTGDRFAITINRGGATLEQADLPDPDLAIETTSAIWAGVFKREISAREALLDGRIRLSGDKLLFTRFDRYFPPPNT